MGVVLQFFTGMYFPIAYLSNYPQQIRRFIPMTCVAQAMRGIMIRNATLNNLLLPIGTLAIAAVILYVAGILLYRDGLKKNSHGL
jgi:ABC-type multidrug transport system permease subunit